MFNLLQILIFLGIGLVGFILKSLYQADYYWKVRNVSHVKLLHSLKIFVNSLIKPISPAIIIQNLYNSFTNSRYVGLYELTKPVLMIRDAELIKQMTVKDFDNFVDRRIFLNEDADVLLGKSLLNLKGTTWREMRAKLSPAFTSSKMRQMHVLISNVAEQLINHLDKSVQESGVCTVEMKDTFTRYTNDVIATTAFGIKCDSLKDQTNDFFMAGKSCTTFTVLSNIKFIGYSLVPYLMRLFNITLFDKRVGKFFRNIIETTIKTREERGIIRPDMIHLLIEAKNGKLKHEPSSNPHKNSEFESSELSTINYQGKELTNEDIAAQAFLFFFAGYETSASMMSFMSYELAVNPDIQKRLQNEIDEYWINGSGKINYEELMKMKYLDMVISESLRKWPPGVFIDRQCLKPYTLEKVLDDENDLVLEKDLAIWIPIYAIHRDPKYFPNPDCFDPERFNDENKSKIIPFSYIPFGSGPRSCIASRFALMEIKTLYVNLLRKFELIIVKETQVPLKLNSKSFNLSSEGGIILGLKPRK